MIANPEVADVFRRRAKVGYQNFKLPFEHFVSYVHDP